MWRHLLELTKHYVLEVLKVDGISIYDVETKLCEGRSGVEFDRASKLSVQPTHYARGRTSLPIVKAGGT
jgi:hypothetical protein